MHNTEHKTVRKAVRKTVCKVKRKVKSKVKRKVKEHSAPFSTNTCVMMSDSIIKIVNTYFDQEWKIDGEQVYPEKKQVVGVKTKFCIAWDTANRKSGKEKELKKEKNSWTEIIEDFKKSLNAKITKDIYIRKVLSFQKLVDVDSPEELKDTHFQLFMNNIVKKQTNTQTIRQYFLPVKMFAYFLMRKFNTKYNVDVDYLLLNAYMRKDENHASKLKQDEKQLKQDASKLKQDENQLKRDASKLSMLVEACKSFPTTWKKPKTHSTSSYFIVEDILDDREVAGVQQYLIRWYGYSDADNTWEPRHHIPEELIEKYEKKFPKINKGVII